MPTLQQLVPDVDVLLALAPDELGGILVARSQRQNGVISFDNISQVTVGYGVDATRQSPWIGREREVELALSEGWNWLVVQRRWMSSVAGHPPSSTDPTGTLDGLAESEQKENQ